MLKQYIAHFRALPVYYELGSVKTVDISTVTFAENKAAALQQVTVSEQLELLKDNQNTWICRINSSNEKKIVVAGSADEAAEKAQLGRNIYLRNSVCKFGTKGKILLCGK